jgi:hypothetical protein
MRLVSLYDSSIEECEGVVLPLKEHCKEYFCALTAGEVRGHAPPPGCDWPP